jgi:hypothetical protein
MSVVTQLYFPFVEENNYMFRPFSGWAIIRLRLEHRGKLIYYNVDQTLKNEFSFPMLDVHIVVSARRMDQYHPILEGNTQGSRTAGKTKDDMAFTDASKLL